MGLFGAEDPITQILREQKETNRLLRALLAVVTGSHEEPKAAPATEKPRIRSAEDVLVVGRSHQIQAERQQMEKQVAPWRNGQDSPMTSPTDGTAPVD